MSIYIIGAGGGGSWLYPALRMLAGRDQIITIMDRDKLTKSNLNRQLFTEEDIGKNKARALAARYGGEGLEGWYTFGCIDHKRSDWLFSCVDNHPGRLAILRACDQFGCRAIIAANEKTSAEAYYYKREWREGPLDPRVYYPDIVTDESDDPTRPETCTGEAQVATPQLVSANIMAISLLQWLYVFWAMKRPEIDSKEEGNFPYHLRANLTSLETFKIKDAKRTSAPEAGSDTQPVAGAGKDTNA